MKVTGKKTSYKPLYRSNGETILRWDYEPVKKDGKDTPLATWQEEVFDRSLTFNEIKAIIISYYNRITDRKILSGFEWKGMKVWLSQENQFNYKASYDMAVQTLGKSLPVTFKFGTDENPVYHVFESLDDISDFYVSSLNFIKDTVKAGWDIKDGIDWDLYK